MKNRFSVGLRSGWLTLITFGILLATVAASRAADNPRVTMSVEKRGDLVIELYQKQAPKTVAHFLALVNKKFYDGIMFHRVIPKFVAQVGDPRTRGLNGSKWNTMDENQIGQLMSGRGKDGSGENVPFEDTGFLNEYGTLAMALQAPASATGDSQFYINLTHNAGLDTQYCVFGKVIKGVELIPKLQQGDKIKSMRVGDSKAGKKDEPKSNKGKQTTSK